MQQIEISCFATSFECQVSSAAARILVDQSSNTVWQLLVHNRSDFDCQLQLRLVEHQASEASFQLQVSDKQQFLYQGGWATAAQSPITSNLGPHQTQTLTYHFDLDRRVAVDTTFDLDFDFTCAKARSTASPTADLTATITPSIAPTASPAASNAAVLWSQASGGFPLAFLWYFLLLCSLCFFVIMRFAHVKKKTRSHQSSLQKKSSR